MFPSLSEFFESTALLAVLLNPFLVVVYLVELMRHMPPRRFASTLSKAGMIAGGLAHIEALGIATHKIQHFL